MGNVNNILAVYAQATEEERINGMNWYQQAHNQAIGFHASPEIACGVVAVISPGLRWSVNLEYARRLILGEDTSGLGRVWGSNLNKAARILWGGENPELVLYSRRYKKVRSFYACLIDPSNAISVCIDGHAAGIWNNKRVPLDKLKGISGKLYDRIASDYRKAASSVGILPHQMQAITWVAWRRIHGIDV